MNKKLKNKLLVYHTVETVPNANIKIVEEANSIPLTHIHHSDNCISIVKYTIKHIGVVMVSVPFVVDRGFDPISGKPKLVSVNRQHKNTRHLDENKQNTHNICWTPPYNKHKQRNKEISSPKTTVLYIKDFY
jgi:hypothetical protein